MKKTIILSWLLCLAILLCSCSANAPAGGDYYPSPGAGDSLSGSENNGSANPGVLSDRKLIRRVSITAETEDMDILLNGLNQRIAVLDGYVESRNIQNGSAYSQQDRRTATLVIRIPAAKLDSFVQQMDEHSNIISTVESSDDVTLQYVDTQSRLKVLRAEEERLLKFLSEAASISEMLEVEKRLTQVQSEIESLTAQLKTYDNLVDYGTVTLKIIEVEVYTPTPEPGLWGTIQEAFTDSVENLGQIGKTLLVFCLGNSPYFLVLALIAGTVAVIIWISERHKKKKARNK